MKIIWAPEAVDDFEAAVTYLAERNRAAATKLSREVFDLVEWLASQPIDGPAQVLRTREVVRSWPLRPFRIYYQRDGDVLRVVRVYHQKREPVTR